METVINESSFANTSLEWIMEVEQLNTLTQMIADNHSSIKTLTNNNYSSKLEIDTLALRCDNLTNAVTELFLYTEEIEQQLQALENKKLGRRLKNALLSIAGWFVSD